MKRTLLSVIALAILVGCAGIMPTGVSAENGYVLPSAIDGCDNIFLSYVFNTNYPNSGRRTVPGYLPLVGYENPDGVTTDIFFDSFLFLPCVTATPSGATTQGHNNKATFSDWKAYIDDTFYKSGSTSYNIPALNEATGIIKTRLGSEYDDYKTDVFFGIMYPTKSADYAFGDIDGDGVNDSMAVQANREKAIKWQIDTFLARFEQGGYENLNFVGFYWYEEALSYNDKTADAAFVSYYNAYVHSLGYKSIWIPYQGATGYNGWASYGFDAACYQPNYFFNANATSSRVVDTCKTAEKYGMGVEIEASGTMFGSVEMYNRYLEYLYYCTKAGANKGVKMYYNDGVPGVYYNAYISDSLIIRSIYDLTYKYAKQTLNPEEIFFLLDDFELDEWHYIVSANKSYYATTPYTDSTAGYQDIDGKELTDRVFSSTYYGTEWHAFHKSLSEEDGGYRISIDLEDTYLLSYFSLNVEHKEDSSIGAPDGVAVYVSEEPFEEAGNLIYAGDLTASNSSFEIFNMVLKTETGIRGRYVHFLITPHASLNFVFVSEATVAASGLSKDDIKLTSTDPAHKFNNKFMFIYGVESGTTKLELRSALSPATTITDQSGNAISSSAVLKTGDKATYTSIDNKKIEMRIAVRGDIVADGRLSAMDYFELKRIVLLEMPGELSALRHFAADYNMDGRISASDYFELKKYILVR